MGDIFFANCFQNGILPIVVDKEIVDSLAAEIEITQGAGRIGIDLEEQTISSPMGKTHRFFEIDPRRREGLLQGLDEVTLTLQRDDEARAFQAADRIGATMDPLCREISMNTRSNMVKVAVVGGEGIGPEVTAQSQRILSWFAAKRGVPMTFSGRHNTGLFHIWRPARCCRTIPSRRWKKPTPSCGVRPVVPKPRWCPRRRARRAACSACEANTADLYANLRPVVANPALADSAPLKAHVLKDVNFVIVRELTSGIYFGEPRGIENLADGPAPRLQHRAIHHQPGPPRGTVCVRTGAYTKK